MRIIRHPDKKNLKGCVVALGTFDGVHRGHQAVLQTAIKHARAIDAAALALTFDPHPQQVVAPERGLKLLTTLKEREALFSAYGMDGVIVFRFNHRLQKMSCQAFVEKYLVARLGVKHVVVGFDYAFGRQRSGSVQELKKMGECYGFAVTVVPRVGLIKSSRLRALLTQGEFNTAVKLLGHPYPVTGRVVRGSGRGKSLGFPTANLKADARKLIPALGVYAGTYQDKKCAVNIGLRPTFGESALEVEVHILGFKGSLRGKMVEINLTRRLRDEKHFSSIAALKEQVARDIKRL